MSVSVSCPSCGIKLDIPDDLLGKKVRCAKCTTIFEARQDSPAAGSAAPLERPPSSRPPEESDERRPRRDRHGLDDDDDDDEMDRRHIRRDVEPHRGGLILGLGISSIVSIFGICICGAFMPLIQIGLGIASWVMGRGDLRKMEQGSMDPDGRGQTKAGYICGIIGLAIGVLMLIAFGAYIAIVIVYTMKQQKRF